MDASNILSRLPIKGAATTAGTSSQSGFIPILDSGGHLDPSVLSPTENITANSLTLPNSSLAADGSALFGANLEITPTGGIVTEGTQGIAITTGALAVGAVDWGAGPIVLNSDGSASFAGGSTQIYNDGTVNFMSGGIIFYPNGDANFSGGQTDFFADGSSEFAGGLITTSVDGTLQAQIIKTSGIHSGSGAAIINVNGETSGDIRLNSDGSASFGNGTLIIDGAGHITAPTFNKLTLTQPASSATLTIANGKTLTCSNILTLAGTDSSTLNVGTGGTLGTAAYTAASAYATAAQGTKADNAGAVNGILTSNGSASFSAAATTGSGNIVKATAPVLVSPVLGAAMATSLSVTGNIAMTSAGGGIQIKGGSNARVGTATLVAGTITVANTSVTTNTRIFVSRQGAAGTIGYLDTSISAGTSFTITSLNAGLTTQTADTSVVSWFLVEQT